jgi:hypothetical protein
VLFRIARWFDVFFVSIRVHYSILYHSLRQRTGERRRNNGRWHHLNSNRLFSHERDCCCVFDLVENRLGPKRRSYRSRSTYCSSTSKYEVSTWKGRAAKSYDEKSTELPIELNWCMTFLLQISRIQFSPPRQVIPSTIDWPFVSRNVAQVSQVSTNKKHFHNDFEVQMCSCHLFFHENVYLDDSLLQWIFHNKTILWCRLGSDRLPLLTLS